MPSVWEKVTENAKLISLPDVYLRLKSVLDDPDYCMGDVANVLSHDPAMTARLLRLVNSAYFGLASKIDTVNRAISMLGVQQVHDLVLAASVAQTFEGMSNHVMDMEKYWRNSVYCAIAARELAVMCNVLDGERVFVAGLLRDIGHLIMYQAAPVPAMQALQQAKKQGAPLYKVEWAMLGIDYAKIGGALMRQWNLPRSLWEPAECHVEPALSQEYRLFTVLVHLASLITHAAQDSNDISPMMSKAAPLAWQLTGLSLEQCAAVPAKVDRQLASVMELIFPTGKQAFA
jgi:HD-like signal output (HDOD) protein